MHMEKTIGAFEARRSFGEILQDVAARGDKYVVERHGKAVAAVVPIEVYEQWKRARGEFFRRLRGLSETANLPPEEAERLAAEAIRAVRRRSAEEGRPEQRTFDQRLSEERSSDE
jgi:prevent-host-death family protein